MAILNCRLCEQVIDKPIFYEQQVFCCHACKQLFVVLGAEQVEQLKSRPGIQWDALKKRPVTENIDLLATAKEPFCAQFTLAGIWCPSCCILIQHVLNRQIGVFGVETDFTESTVKVLYDGAKTNHVQIEHTIEKLGYATTHSSIRESGDDAALTSLRQHLCTAALFTFLMMMLSIPVWSGYLPILPKSFAFVLSGGLFVLATPIVFWSGWSFLRGAWRSLVCGVPTMDLLVSLGSLSAYMYSVVNLFIGGDYLYFDTCGLLITFLLFSRVLEASARQRATAMLDLVQQVLPKKACRLMDRNEEWIDVLDLQVGDHVLVRSGESIPIDGRVVSGRSETDESILTGESSRIPKGIHSLVYAGTTHYGSPLRIEVLRVKDTLLAQTVMYVRHAKESQSKWTQLAQRVLVVFVPAVLALAIGTWIIGRFVSHVSISQAVLHAISVLVIGCPCALSIATPVALIGGAHALAKRGILLRSPDAIERAQKISCVGFDKTGTLTTGKMTVYDYWPRLNHTQWNVEEEHWLRLAASAEFSSEHPIADAMTRFAHQQNWTLDAVQSYTEKVGWGIAAYVRGRYVRVGATSLHCEIPDLWQPFITKWQMLGLTVSFVVIDDQLSGILSYSSELRPEANRMIQELKKARMKIFLTSGDHESAVQPIAAQLGIEQYYFRQSALDKAQLISKLKQAGEFVCFVGDGINDAPALTQANLGIAMGTSADIALEAGHMVLANNQLQHMPWAFDVMHLTTSIVKQNLLWALCYNLIAQIIALSGWATPALAAGAMACSSLFVLGNSLRIVGWSPWLYVRRIGMVATVLSTLILLVYFQV